MDHDEQTRLKSAHDELTNALLLTPSVGDSSRVHLLRAIEHIEAVLEGAEEVYCLGVEVADGEPPDEEHERILDAWEVDNDDPDASLAELNRALAACARPASASFVDEDDEDEEDEDEDEDDEETEEFAPPGGW